MHLERNICVKLQDKFYLLSTIRINTDKMEVFYHFPWGSRSLAEIETTEGLQPLKEYMPDHISFHIDGTIHFKARDAQRKKRYWDVQNLDFSPFNLHRNTVAWLLVESFQTEHGLNSLGLQEIDVSKSSDCLIFDLGTRKAFSLVLLSTDEMYNPKNVMKPEILGNLELVDTVFVIDVFSSSDKSIALSSEELNSSYGSKIIAAICAEELPPPIPEKHEITGEYGHTIVSLMVTPPPDKILNFLKKPGTHESLPIIGRSKSCIR